MSTQWQKPKIYDWETASWKDCDVAQLGSSVSSVLSELGFREPEVHVVSVPTSAQPIASSGSVPSLSVPRSAAGSDWSWLWLTVGLGASAVLCYAAWKYYNRSTCLRTYGRDMTALAGETDPVIGRDDEIGCLVCILCRRTKNCAALVGAAGVGKTAIAEGLAQRIAAGRVPEALAGARVVEVDLAALVAGTKFRGMFEERMKDVIKQAEDAHGKVILFFDEMHTILDAGSSRVSDSGNMLKPALAHGRIRCVGATTYDEYRKYIEKDPALERRFQKVHVEEPSTQATVAILQGLKRRYQKHHGLKIQDDALVAAAHLAARYVTDRQFADKAIDLIDEACSTKKLQTGCEPEEKKLIVGPDDIARIVS